MSATETVTFILPAGTKVTAPRRIAERMGWTSPADQKDSDEPKPTAKRTTRRKAN